MRARLGAAKVGLGGKVCEERRMISRTQVCAIEALASRDPGLNGVSPENRATLVDFASTTNWHDGDLAKVLKCLEPPQEKEKQTRRPGQQFAPGILGYFTDTEWGIMLNPKDKDKTQDLILNRIIQLSGRNLTEPALKFVSSLMIFLANGQQTKWMMVETKKAFYQNVKKEFKAKARYQSKPDPYIVSLPTSPEGLKEKHPELYASVFPEPPVLCRIDLMGLMRLDSSYMCRGGKPSNPQGLPGDMGTGGMDICVQMLLQQMSAMQQHQLLLTGRDGSTLSNAMGPSLKCLAALSKPSGPQVEHRLLHLPGPSDSQSSVVSSGPNASALDPFPASQLQTMPPAAIADPAGQIPAPQPLPPSLQKMSSSASFGDRTTAPLRLLDMGVADAEMPLDKVAMGDAHRTTDVPTTRPTEVLTDSQVLRLSDEETTRLAEVVRDSQMHHLSDVQTHRHTEELVPHLSGVETPRLTDPQAHRLSDVEKPRPTDVLPRSPCPPIANLQQSSENIAQVAPARTKASLMLQDFTDMQAERADRKRMQPDSPSETDPAAKSAAKAKAKSTAKAAPKSASRKAATKAAKAAAKASAVAKAKAKAVAKAAAVPEAGIVTYAVAKLTHERSRSQFCARSGKGGPGSAAVFRYDPNDAASKEQAEQDAHTWLDKFIE